MSESTLQIDGIPVALRAGETVLEAYFGGHHADERAPLYSVTKSYLSALVGIAIADGAIPDDFGCFSGRRFDVPAPA